MLSPGPSVYLLSQNIVGGLELQSQMYTVYILLVGGSETH